MRVHGGEAEEYFRTDALPTYARVGRFLDTSRALLARIEAKRATPRWAATDGTSPA